MDNLNHQKNLSLILLFIDGVYTNNYNHSSSINLMDDLNQSSLINFMDDLNQSSSINLMDDLNHSSSII
jgi:hypothetical protein